ncbi:hypothetical protein ACTFIV_009199 [Dictyostelium citrinum]
MEQLRVLEFYSGIGGMHYGLQESGLDFQVIQSFDINTNANLNYKYTFNEDSSQKSIESYSVEDLEGFKANAWLMSPPCQPFTRLGLQKDDQDNRTNSFFHLLDVLTKLKVPPTYILIENVFGFAKKGSSNTRDHLLDTLTKMGYSFQEFHLSPQQFGLPNQRLRYFCIAKRNGKLNLKKEQQEEKVEKNEEKEDNKLNNNNNNNNNNCIDNNNEDRYDNLKILDHIPGYSFHTTLEECDEISNYFDKDLTDDELYEKYKVPHNLLLSKGMLFDIKQKDSKTSNCVTKSYGKFIEGTGSIVQMDSNFKADINDTKSLIPLRLRYFSPKEITRLHGFPEEFKFSPKLTTIQCYRLIGNSLNVKIVSELLKVLVIPNEEEEKEKENQ